MSLQSNSEKQGINDESIHKKFDEAFENMQNFQNMISMYSTGRGRKTPQKRRQIDSYNQHSPISSDFLNKQRISPIIIPKQQKNNHIFDEIIDFGEGWSYSGKTCQKKFHGYGYLMYQQDPVYSGQFCEGFFHGTGTLFYHPTFANLIHDCEAWIKYEGQFKDGDITGFGNLYEIKGNIKSGYWKAGNPHFSIDIDQFI